jgi:hypothetical protein
MPMEKRGQMNPNSRFRMNSVVVLSSRFFELIAASGYRA